MSHFLRLPPAPRFIEVLAKACLMPGGNPFQRLMLALNVAAMCCQGLIPSCRGVLPLGGSDLAQLGAFFAISMIISEMTYCARHVLQPFVAPPPHPGRAPRHPHPPTRYAPESCPFRPSQIGDRCRVRARSVRRRRISSNARD